MKRFLTLIINILIASIVFSQSIPDGTLFPVSIGLGKVAFLDNTGELTVILDKYPNSGERYSQFNNGLAVMQFPNLKYGYIDKYGNTIIGPLFDKAFPFENNRARVTVNNLYGIIDKNGSYIIHPKYDDMSEFYNNTAIVQKGTGSTGLIDINTDRIIYPFKISRIRALSGNPPYYYFVVTVEGRHLMYSRNFGEFTDTSSSIIDEDGNTLYDFDKDYTLETAYGDGVFGIRKDLNITEVLDGKTTYTFFVDINGNVVIEEGRYNDKFSDGLSIVSKLVYNNSLKRKTSKYGYIDLSGKTVIPCIYDHVSDFENGFAIVKKDSQEYYITKDGRLFARKTTINGDIKTTLQPDYLEHSYFKIRKEYPDGSRYGIMDTNENIVLQTEYYNIRDYYGHGIFNVSEIIDDEILDFCISAEKKIVNPYSTENLTVFYNHWIRFPSYYKDRVYGYISNSGELEIIPYFDDIKGFSNGLAPVKKRNKWGYIDSDGTIVIQPQFDDVLAFKDGFAIVSSGKEVFYIDRSGQKQDWGEFDQIFPFSEGLARIIVDGNHGYINIEGETQIKPIYPSAFDFSEGLAAVQIDGKFGFIDKTGQLVIDAEFDGADKFSEGYARAFKDGSFSYIDKDGNTIIPPGGFSFINHFNEGMAAVQKGDKYGYINKEGKTVIPIIYDSTSYFYDGLAVFQENDKKGYLDKTGKKVIPAQFTLANAFVNGIAHAATEDTQGYINKQGRFIYTW